MLAVELTGASRREVRVVAEGGAQLGELYRLARPHLGHPVSAVERASLLGGRRRGRRVWKRRPAW